MARNPELDHEYRADRPEEKKSGFFMYMSDDFSPHTASHVQQPIDSNLMTSLAQNPDSDMPKTGQHTLRKVLLVAAALAVALLVLAVAEIVF